MSDPVPGRPPSRRLNFTALQFILFAGAGLVGLAVLSAAGLAFGLALAGATMVAVLALATWFIIVNLVGGARDRRDPPTVS